MFLSKFSKFINLIILLIYYLIQNEYVIFPVLIFTPLPLIFNITFFFETSLRTGKVTYSFYFCYIIYKKRLVKYMILIMVFI